MQIYLIFILGLFSVAMALAAENPHEISQLKLSEGCLQCHLVLPKNVPTQEGRDIIPDMANYKGDGVALCKNCHDPKRASHMVGVKIKFSLPKQLPLTEEKVTCLTCHYSHGSFYTEQPRASINFFDRLFNTERMHNSYLLRLNNTEGELCLLCHQVQSE